MTNKRKPAKMKTMMKALKSTMGNVSASCEKVNINRSTHYDWYNNFEEYKEYVDNLPEYVGDFVEGSLMKQIKEGNTTATIFYAKTKLRHRGYDQRISVQHSGKVDLKTYQVVSPDDWDEENKEDEE